MTECLGAQALDASVASAVAEQQARLAEVGRLVAAHAAWKADDLAETRRRTAALQTRLTGLAECAREATGATAAASSAGLQARTDETRLARGQPLIDISTRSDSHLPIKLYEADIRRAVAHVSFD